MNGRDVSTWYTGDPVADPGFPPRRGRQLPGGGGGGAPTYNFAKFSQKLHEIERFGPGGRLSRPP